MNKTCKIKHKNGFTLMEMIIVSAVIIILATLTGITVNNVRVKSRDMQRINDVKEMQAALDHYKRDNGLYPDELTPGVSLLSPDGNKTYLDIIPSYPDPYDGNCADGLNYSYYRSDSNPYTYSLFYCLGSSAHTIDAGYCTATPKHICSPPTYYSFTQTDTFDPGPNSGGGQDVIRDGNFLYFGGTYGLYSFRISSAGTLTQVDHVTGGNFEDLYMVEDFLVAFHEDTSLNKYLKSYSINSSGYFSEVGSITYDGDGYKRTCVINNYAYNIVQGGTSYDMDMYEINPSTGNVSSAVAVEEPSGRTPYDTCAVSEEFMFLETVQDGEIDIVKPSADGLTLTLLSTITTINGLDLNEPERLSVVGNNLYMAAGAQGSAVYNFTDPANPVEISYKNEGTEGNHPDKFTTGERYYLYINNDNSTSNGDFEIWKRVAHNDYSLVHTVSMTDADDAEISFDSNFIYISSSSAGLVVLEKTIIE